MLLFMFCCCHNWLLCGPSSCCGYIYRKQHSQSWPYDLQVCLGAVRHSPQSHSPFSSCASSGLRCDEIEIELCFSRISPLSSNLPSWDWVGCFLYPIPHLRLSPLLSKVRLWGLTLTTAFPAYGDIAYSDISYSDNPLIVTISAIPKPFTGKDTIWWQWQICGKGDTFWLTLNWAIGFWGNNHWHRHHNFSNILKIWGFLFWIQLIKAYHGNHGQSNQWYKVLSREVFGLASPDISPHSKCGQTF